MSRSSWSVSVDRRMKSNHAPAAEMDACPLRSQFALIDKRRKALPGIVGPLKRDVITLTELKLTLHPGPRRSRGVASRSAFFETRQHLLELV